MAKPIEQPAPEPVDKQKEYLVEKFGGLIKQIGDGYGQPLQEELIRRLEKTISEFHDEVTELIDTLKNRSAERQQKLKELWEKGAEVAEPDAPAAESVEGEEEDLSEWEQRLEEKSKKAGSSSKVKGEEEKPKKKGLFGKKK